MLRKGLAIVLVAAALAGCAGDQAADPTGASGRFTPGVTTRAQAVAELGPPSSIFDLADGSRTLTWARSGGLFAQSATRSLSIQFGSDEKMLRIVSGAPEAQ